MMVSSQQDIQKRVKDSNKLTDEEIESLVLSVRDAYYENQSVRLELTDKAVNDLATRAKEGDELARELVIIWAARLVAPHPAHIQWIKYSSVGPEDMWQEGRIAVMVAIDRYNAEKGYDFGAYASKIVANTLGEWAERHSLVISVPRHARRRLRREGIIDETTRLAKIAEQLPRYLSSLMSPTEDHLSSGDGMLAVLADESDDASPEVKLEKKEESLEVRRAFFSLDPLEQKVLYHRYVLGLSLERTYKLLKIGIPVLKGLEVEGLQHLNEALQEYLHDS